MAKKNSTGGGIVIIGLIVLVMVAKYWYLLVTVGAIALIRGTRAANSARF
jgi:hypothetical protein